MFVGHQKGRTSSNGRPPNLGYAFPPRGLPQSPRQKKKKRCMARQVRGLPIITFIDTPGAYPASPRRKTQARQPSSPKT